MRLDFDAYVEDLVGITEEAKRLIEIIYEVVLHDRSGVKIPTMAFPYNQKDFSRKEAFKSVILGVYTLRYNEIHKPYKDLNPLLNALNNGFKNSFNKFSPLITAFMTVLDSKKVSEAIKLNQKI